MALSPPQPLEPPVLPDDTRYDTVLLNRKTTSASHEGLLRRMYPQYPTEMLPEQGIQLPAIRSMVSFLPRCHHETLDVSPRFQYAANAGSASNSGQGLERLPLLRESNSCARVASTTSTEPTFAALLAAGHDMRTVLEAMDQELSPEDVVGFFQVDLARPPMPEEPVPDPDYKPRPSTVTGKAPVDPRHSKKETERRAQHKYYLDLSETKIPDYFLKLCGWDEPKDSGTKRTPRTKSSVLQAGCLYMWFLSGPVLRCLKSLLHANHNLKEEVQRLKNENDSLRVQGESSETNPQIKDEHKNVKSPSLTLTESHCSPSPSAPSLNGLTVLDESSISVRPATHLSLPSDWSTSGQPKSTKRRGPSFISHGECSPASPSKKRKTVGRFIDKQAGAVRLTFDDDMEESLPDVDIVRAQNKDDLTPTQMYRRKLLPSFKQVLVARLLLRALIRRDI
jgi:hypothetical protein